MAFKKIQGEQLNIIDVALDISRTPTALGYLSDSIDDINWKGEWQAGTSYKSNNLVVDNAWLMIANKDTTDRPAPQLRGTTITSPPKSETWAEISDTSLVKMVHKYTMHHSGVFTELRLRTPFYDSNSVANITIIEPSGSSKVINNPTLKTNDWVTLPISNFPVIANDVIEIWFEYHNSSPGSPPSGFSGDWNSSVGVGSTTDGVFDFDSLSTPTLIIIDNDALSDTGFSDHSTNLATVEIDTIINVTEITDVGNSITLKVTSLAFDGTSFTFGVSVIGKGKPISAGSRHQLTFREPIVVPTRINRIVDFWQAGNFPSWAATVASELYLDGIQQAEPNDAYGIELTFQEYIMSPDWETVQPPGNIGSTGGGVSDHLLLSNIGVNSHAQIDTHIASTAINPHATTIQSLADVTYLGSPPAVLTNDVLRWDGTMWATSSKGTTADNIVYDNTNTNLLGGQGSPPIPVDDVQAAVESLNRIMHFRSSVHSGVFAGGLITRASGTEFNVTAGSGLIVESIDNPGDVLAVNIVWPEMLNVTLSQNPTGRCSTHIFIDQSGTLVQFTSKPATRVFTENVYLGTIEYSNFIIQQTQSVIARPIPVNSTANTLTSYIDYLEDSANLVDVNPVAIGHGEPTSQLEFYTTAGKLFQTGINWHNDPHEPNIIPVTQNGSNAVGSPITYPTNTGALFDYILKDGTVFAADAQILDSTVYDTLEPIGSPFVPSVPGVVPAGMGVIHFIIKVLSGKTYVQPHFKIYRNGEIAANSLVEALAERQLARGLENGVILGAYVGESGITTWELTSKSSIIAFDHGYSNSGSALAWGNITGTISNQTDLQAELDLKATDVDLTAHTGDGTNPHSTTVVNLNDTVITGIATNDLLGWDGSNWINTAPTGLTSFTGLTDTPATYVGSGGFNVKVNVAADGLEFIATAATGSSAAPYNFSTVTAVTDPGNGNVALNDIDPNAATVITISSIDTGGNTRSHAAMSIGDRISIAAADADFVEFTITGIITIVATHSNIPVTPITVVGTLIDAEAVTVQMVLVPIKNFINMFDTPAAYGTFGGSVLAVNSGETAVEFTANTIANLADTLITAPGANQFLSFDGTTWTNEIQQLSWGSFTGTLSDQSDLQAELDAKTNVTVFDAHTATTSIHFSEATINHANIIDSGAFSHANIDSHIGNVLNPHATNFANLTDSLISGAPVTDDVLQWDGTQWVDNTLSISHLADVLTTTPTNNQVLAWNTTNARWENSATPIAGLDHDTLANVGTNTHGAIDTHLADGTIHYPQTAIDHLNILNTGVQTHGAIDTHIADGTIHFTESSIVHQNISGGNGANTHAQIDAHITTTDAHIADVTTNPHATTVANLADTVITTPAIGHRLEWDGTNWINVLPYSPLIVSNQGASFTPALSDVGNIINMTGGGIKIVTLPSNATVPFKFGDEIIIQQWGAGAVTFAAGAGATVVSAGNRLTITEQYSGVTAIYKAADLWTVMGDLRA